MWVYRLTQKDLCCVGFDTMQRVAVSVALRSGQRRLYPESPAASIVRFTACVCVCVCVRVRVCRNVHSFILVLLCSW